MEESAVSLKSINIWHSHHQETYGKILLAIGYKSLQ